MYTQTFWLKPWWKQSMLLCLKGYPLGWSHKTSKNSFKWPKRSKSMVFLCLEYYTAEILCFLLKMTRNKCNLIFICCIYISLAYLLISKALSSSSILPSPYLHQGSMTALQKMAAFARRKSNTSDKLDLGKLQNWCQSNGVKHIETFFLWGDIFLGGGACCLLFWMVVLTIIKHMFVWNTPKLGWGNDRVQTWEFPQFPWSKVRDLEVRNPWSGLLLDMKRMKMYGIFD